MDDGIVDIDPSGDTPLADQLHLWFNELLDAGCHDLSYGDALCFVLADLLVESGRVSDY